MVVVVVVNSDGEKYLSADSSGGVVFKANDFSNHLFIKATSATFRQLEEPSPREC